MCYYYILRIIILCFISNVLCLLNQASFISEYITYWCWYIMLYYLMCYYLCIIIIVEIIHVPCSVISLCLIVISFTFILCVTLICSTMMDKPSYFMYSYNINYSYYCIMYYNMCYYLCNIGWHHANTCTRSI